MRAKFDAAKRLFSLNSKHPGLLLGLVCAGIIVCGRIALNGPSASPASMIRDPQPAISNRAAAAPPSSALQDWLAQPQRPLERNLFASSPQLAASPVQPKTLHAQHEQLELQTTIMDSPARAMVNGHLVQEGDTVDGFTIVKIQPRKILVQQDGPIIEIKMP